MSDMTRPAVISGRRLPNIWDIAALLCVVAVFVVVGNAARGTFVPLNAANATRIDLDPSHLPAYAVRTTIRMFAALACSLLFTFAFAPLAAKSRRAGLVMIPLLDIL